MPMKYSIFKLTWRSIRSFWERYIALLFIVMLSVGFFAGLKITKEAMANTCEEYLNAQHFYDFQIISSLGFSENDVESLKELSYVELAEGGKTADAMMEHGGSISPFKLLAMPEQINIPSLVAGRMPESHDECLADAKVFAQEDIGTVISLADENDEAVSGQIEGVEFTIVGLANSPLYLNAERGAASIGNGVLEGFLYLPEENFTGESYTAVNLTLKETAPIYSSDYEDLIAERKNEITDFCRQLADKRYEDMLENMGLLPEMAIQAGIAEPEIYVLTRAENAGYVGFENDTSIVSGIANIFPVFFILIAMLVCITTMTRMVDEERTQIGVLKAMGFGNGAIMAKYLLYAGSATLIGWGSGFLLGTWGLPQVFWAAYSSLYDFASLSYLFSPYLALLTLSVSLVGILGSTWISCRKELGSEPAKLIRPRAAKAGKRIFLERMKVLWKRLSFLQKITLRNMFRYKRRLIMMLVGISCCAGLVVTAFGVRDSMIKIGSKQFENIQKYAMEAVFSSGMSDAIGTELDGIDGINDYMACSMIYVDLYGSKTMSSVNLLSFDEIGGLSDFWNFYSDGNTIPFPEKGEALISTRIAEKLDLSVGDSLEIQNADMQSINVTVAGVFENYVNNFVAVSADTYEEGFGKWEANTVLLSVSRDTREMVTALTDIAGITSVTQLSSTKETVDSSLSCLNYIIWLIVLFSGALAFIVIFNLTNINLAERSREIATVEVLGFYQNETESYVLRENLVLSVIAAVIGLPLGTVFHRIVMDMIVIDALSFDIHISAVSYIVAFVCTVLFAVIVNLFMKRQIGKIQMAESLKAVE